jgi:hypothetical protein
VRKIKTARLLISGLIYRLTTVVVETVALKLITGQWRTAIELVSVLSLINLVTYYTYHYWFARCVKLGVNNSGHNLADR